MSSGSAFSGFDTNTKHKGDTSSRHNQSQSIPKFKPDIDVSNISLLESQTRATTEAKMLNGTQKAQTTTKKSIPQATSADCRSMERGQKFDSETNSVANQTMVSNQLSDSMLKQRLQESDASFRETVFNPQYPPPAGGQIKKKQIPKKGVPPMNSDVTKSLQSSTKSRQEANPAAFRTFDDRGITPEENNVSRNRRQSANMTQNILPDSTANIQVIKDQMNMIPLPSHRVNLSQEQRVMAQTRLQKSSSISNMQQIQQSKPISRQESNERQPVIPSQEQMDQLIAAFERQKSSTQCMSTGGKLSFTAELSKYIAQVQPQVQEPLLTQRFVSTTSIRSDNKENTSMMNMKAKRNASGARQQRPPLTDRTNISLKQQ